MRPPDPQAPPRPGTGSTRDGEHRSFGNTIFEFSERTGFHAPDARVRTPAGPSAASELSQLCAWRRDLHPARTEIDDQDGVLLDADDPAEAVLIVCHLVLHGELLGRRNEGRGAEGTCGQEGPASVAGVFHHDQYAPLTLAGSSGLPGVRPPDELRLAGSDAITAARWPTTPRRSAAA